MAIAEGMCKNCGSLIMLEDREDICECLFCNCVLSVNEAMAIARNPKDREFPNEPMEKRTDIKRHSVTPVFQDPIPAAVSRAEKTTAAQKPEVVEYEVSPDDVKMPKKTLAVILAISAAFIVLVLAISIPLSVMRSSHREALSEKMPEVFTEFKVDTRNPEGYYVGFYMNGQNNTELSVVTEEKIDEEAVLITFQNYALLRAAEYGIDETDFGACYAPLSLNVYGDGAAFTISVESEGDLTIDSVKALA